MNTSTFQCNSTGVLKQELITYRVRDGQLVKETITRRFNDDEWYDTSTVDPLLEIK